MRDRSKKCPRALCTFLGGIVKAPFAADAAR